MRTTKEVLSQECDNLQAVLEDTLRFKYGLEGSQQFFDECNDRLAFIKSDLSSNGTVSSQSLANSALSLIHLSALISRIERSSLGEYSWPFVEELKRIAMAVCTEDTVTEPNRKPLVHVLSDGGLDKYAIYTEANRPSGAGKRILTIVFPRSLKHFVLFHSILGHELGHAMWQCSEHQDALKHILRTHLFATGIFSSPTETLAWLYSADAPDEVKAYLAYFQQKALITRSNFFVHGASWEAWREEILCDFIGLITFGPSFVAALCNLLYALDPKGLGIGSRHPPVGCRVNYVLSGAALLGYDTEEFSNADLKTSVNEYWASVNGRRQGNAWFDLFDNSQIERAGKEIAGLLQTLGNACYKNPTEPDLQHLLSQLNRNIPPTGCSIIERTINCREIDFRHTLYAGWIKSLKPDGLTFEQINKLCEHGILQQRAIDIQFGRA